MISTKLLCVTENVLKHAMVTLYNALLPAESDYRIHFHPSRPPLTVRDVAILCDSKNSRK